MPTYGPKKPSAPYFIFMAAVRDQVKAENPGASSTVLCSLLGQQWRSLTPDAKAIYERQAESDRIRYQREYEQWVFEHPEDVALANEANEAKAAKTGGRKRSASSTAIQPAQKPKRALSGYVFFSNAVRDETKKEAPHAKVSQTQPSVLGLHKPALHSLCSVAAPPGLFAQPEVPRLLMWRTSLGTDQDDGLEQDDGS